MIQSYPGAAQPSGTIERPAPPASVLNAVKVMYAGAVACALWPGSAVRDS
jgi:hypothetical protein